MLKLEHVTKYYGDFKAVDDLSFTVNPGEIFGLLGINGSGKTTTFRMIMNLLDDYEGKITLFGKPVDYSVTDTIGFLTEERSLLTKLTVIEQAIYYGTLKGMTDKKIISKLDELLERFGITEYKNKKIKELSKGNQQKIQFITAIINEPKLLIADEPFSGLDPFNIKLFEKELLNLAASGSMVIFSSHRMDHVEQFCEKLVILKDGHPVIAGNLKQIKKDFRKKNILIDASVTLKDLRAVSGVVSAESRANDIIVSVEDESIIDKVFDVVKKAKKVTKFIVEEPSLDEIFIEKVGESYEEK